MLMFPVLVNAADVARFFVSIHVIYWHLSTIHRSRRGKD